MIQPETKCECKSCGTPMKAEDNGPCPNCGKDGKNVGVTLYEKVSISDSLERIEKNIDYSFVGILFSIVGFVLSLNQIVFDVKFDFVLLLLLAVGFCIFVICLYLLIKILRRDSRRVKDFKIAIKSTVNKTLDSSSLNPSKNGCD